MKISAPAPLPPTTIVILGGTGNLAETKLLPALFDLYVHAALPSAFSIVSLSRKAWSDAQYQAYVVEAVSLARRHADASLIAGFAKRASYRRGSFDDPHSYQSLKEALTLIDESCGQCSNKLFYLAVPPQFYSTIFSQLSTSGVMALCDGADSWARLLVEKPFGRDLETAKALEQQLCAQFKEEQIYRIDHYLAKDAIENIIALRFANSILNDSWHGGEIESITIRLLETKNVATRGTFYDGVGTLRDVGQNHMLQILALLTMAPADIHDVPAMRQARTEVLQALIEPTDFVRGQYDGYRDTAGVAPDSVTETYFRLTTTLSLDNWSGVPITLEAGKALDQTLAEAVITFKGRDVCHCAAEAAEHKHQNVLTITFSPEQKITLRIFNKRPGFAFVLEPRELELVHATGQDAYSPEAYERVLYDCILGDQTRFVSGEEVVAAWRFITPLLVAKEVKLETYAEGSSGPVA